MTNLDDLLGNLDKLLMELPNGTPVEMRADVNKIIQSHKKIVNENKDSILKGGDVVHSVESFQRKADFMMGEFTEKYGTKGNK